MGICFDVKAGNKQKMFMRTSRRIAFHSCVLSSMLSASILGWAAGYGTSKETAVAPPPLPAIHSLKLEPASLTLKDGRAERRVLVWGKSDGDKLIDLTSQATFKPESPNVEVDSSGYIRPKAKGSAEIIVSAAGQQIKLPVVIEDAALPSVRFARDIEPVLSKAGCNAGT